MIPRSSLIKIQEHIFSSQFDRMLLKEESLSRKFITRGAWIYFFIFLAAPLGYITRIILTGELTPEEVGIIYGTMSLLSLLGTYTDFWLTESLNYFLPKYIIKNDYIRVRYLLSTTLWTQIITSSIVSIGFFFWSRWISDSYFHTLEAKGVIEILSLYFIGSHLLQVILTFLNAIQNIKAQKTLDFIRTLMVALWAGILLLSGTGDIIRYTWIWIIGIYTALISWGIYFYRTYYRLYLDVPSQRDLHLRKVFFQYSLGTLFSANVATVLHQVDLQFLTYFLWVYNTGIYSIYLSLVGIPFIFLSPIISFLFPVISELGGKGEESKIQSIFQIFSTPLAVIMIWIGVIFFLSGNALSWLLFGDRFIASGEALMFIAPFLVLNVLFQMHFQILWWLGHVRKRITILVWTLWVNIGTNLFCIIWYKYWVLPFPSGSAAASFSVGISWIFMWYLSYRAVREYAVGFDWIMFTKNLMMALLMVIAWKVLWNDINSTLWNHEWRTQYIPTIWLAFWLSLIIFSILNRWSISHLIDTIKKVKNGTL